MQEGGDIGQAQEHKACGTVLYPVCNLKFVIMIELLKHISIEHVEVEEDLDQSLKIGHHITDTEPINIKAIRSKCEKCEIVLTKDDVLENHEDNIMCRLCTYASVLNM